MCNDNNIINVNTIYSDKIATKYFEKLNSLSKGQKILQNYKESIQRSATSGTPLCYIFEKSEFKSKNFLSIKKQLEEKHVSLVCLAEKMGYKVKNKKEGPFIQDDYAGIVLNIEINKEKQNIDNVIQFDKYIK